MLNVVWQDIYHIQMGEGAVRSLPGGESYLDPSMALFGVDPGKSAVNYLLVDSKGLAEGGRGSIVANTATFRTSCVNAAAMFLQMENEKKETDRVLQGVPYQCRT